MTVLKVVIVGAGLFGSVISATLRRDGHEVVVIDARNPNAGSVPAACLMKPSWAASMNRTGEYDRAIELLGELYGVQSIPFTVKPTGIKVPMHWVDPSKILVAPDIIGTVMAVGTGRVGWHSLRPVAGPEAWETYDVLIMACGSEFTDIPGLQGLGGWAFTWPGQVEEPTMRIWSPYKQLVAFNRGDDHIWVGDGTSLLEKSLTEDRMRQSLERCAREVGRDPDEATVLKGFRPKVKGLEAPAYLEEAVGRPGTWIVTGGAKNGTLGAAWAARQFSEKFRAG